MHIILMGAQGTGKGTQAGILARELGVPHISTGDMLRQAIAEGTPLGRQAQELVNQGHLVPDEIMIGIVRERLAQPDCVRGFILDGFPRTIPQAEAFDRVLRELGYPLRAVINLEVPREILAERMTGRRICKQCGAIYHVRFQPPRVEGTCDRCGGELYQRADDHPEAIEKRLNAYFSQTLPLLDYYRTRGLLHTIDGTQAVEGVTAAILTAVNARAMSGEEGAQ